MYFNYHAKVMRLIESGQAECYEFLKEYHKISPCLLIYFKNHPPMPIREHKFDEYMFLLAKYGVFERSESPSENKKNEKI